MRRLILGPLLLALGCTEPNPGFVTDTSTASGSTAAASSTGATSSTSTGPGPTTGPATTGPDLTSTTTPVSTGPMTGSSDGSTTMMVGSSSTTGGGSTGDSDGSGGGSTGPNFPACPGDDPAPLIQLKTLMNAPLGQASCQLLQQNASYKAKYFVSGQTVALKPECFNPMLPVGAVTFTLPQAIDFPWGGTGTCVDLTLIAHPYDNGCYAKLIKISDVNTKEVIAWGEFEAEPILGDVHGLNVAADSPVPCSGEMCDKFTPGQYSLLASKMSVPEKLLLSNIVDPDLNHVFQFVNLRSHVHDMCNLDTPTTWLYFDYYATRTGG